MWIPFNTFPELRSLSTVRGVCKIRLVSCVQYLSFRCIIPDFPGPHSGGLPRRDALGHNLAELRGAPRSATTELRRGVPRSSAELHRARYNLSPPRSLQSVAAPAERRGIFEMLRGAPQSSAEHFRKCSAAELRRGAPLRSSAAELRGAPRGYAKFGIPIFDPSPSTSFPKDDLMGTLITRSLCVRGCPSPG
eukprot:gene17596-biopygen8959